jgi:uncharacterized protein
LNKAKLLNSVNATKFANLALFGSVLRDDFKPDSDVDVLVEYEPEARITLLDMAVQEIELSDIIGRKVDLRTAEDLSRYFRDKVVATAEKIYERS